MIDFHSHILPQMDDGADCVETSLAMLRKSFRQGVDAIVSTSHFYADEDYPQRFAERRLKAFQILEEAMLLQAEVFVVAIIVCLINLLVDILYAACNPRIRY